MRLGYPQAGDSRAKSLAKQAHESYDVSFQRKKSPFYLHLWRFKILSCPPQNNESPDVVEEDISTAETSLNEESVETQLISEELTTVTDNQSSHQMIPRTSTSQRMTLFKSQSNLNETEEIQDLVLSSNFQDQCELTNKDLEVSDLTRLHTKINHLNLKQKEHQKQEDTPQTILSIPDGNEYLFGARI